MLVTLKVYCEAHELPFKRVRRLARKGQIVGVEKLLGRWGIDEDAPVPILPEPKARAGRSDGRKVYKIYLTDAEGAALAAEGYDVKSLAAIRKARKEARKEDKDE